MTFVKKHSEFYTAQTAEETPEALEGKFFSLMRAYRYLLFESLLFCRDIPQIKLFRQSAEKSKLTGTSQTRKFNVPLNIEKKHKNDANRKSFGALLHFLQNLGMFDFTIHRNDYFCKEVCEHNFN